MPAQILRGRMASAFGAVKRSAPYRIFLAWVDIVFTPTEVFKDTRAGSYPQHVKPWQFFVAMASLYALLLPAAFTWRAEAQWYEALFELDEADVLKFLNSTGAAKHFPDGDAELLQFLLRPEGNPASQEFMRTVGSLSAKRIAAQLLKDEPDLAMKVILASDSVEREERLINSTLKFLFAVMIVLSFLPIQIFVPKPRPPLKRLLAIAFYVGGAVWLPLMLAVQVIEAHGPFDRHGRLMPGVKLAVLSVAIFVVYHTFISIRTSHGVTFRGFFWGSTLGAALGTAVTLGITAGMTWVVALLK
ncbi:MAG: hypothetical protein JNN08_09525 [Bryobacterales bacterium]|nr:hypothetical protein [Bryobacterales bacterium]